MKNMLFIYFKFYNYNLNMLIKFIVIVINTQQIKIVLNAQPIPVTSEIEYIIEYIINFNHVKIGLSQYLITARYDLYHEHQLRLTLNVHLIWPMSFRI